MHADPHHPSPTRTPTAAPAVRPEVERVRRELTRLMQP